MLPSRYRLVRTIASGGMAQVLEAVAVGDAGFERRVAIKRILPHLEHREQFREMFFEEARLASMIHHGSVVQVLDYGVVDDGQFLVMEYVDGLEAAEACHLGRNAGNPVPEGVALHVVCEVANALRHVHALRGPDGAALGIVHRDISPQNVLLSFGGDVKLSDFGIAFAQNKSTKTERGVVKGKASYMSPEQLRGDPVASPADVYSLGATLHAMLVGRSPHTDQILDRIAKREAIPLDASLPADIAAFIARCMAPEPGDRPSAEAVAAEAGRLSAARLTRDARGALREWLEAVSSARSEQGGLDELMGLMLVAAPDEVSERTFAVSSEQVAERTGGGDRATIPWGPDGLASARDAALSQLDARGPGTSAATPAAKASGVAAAPEEPGTSAATPAALSSGAVPRPVAPPAGSAAEAFRADPASGAGAEPGARGPTTQAMPATALPSGTSSPELPQGLSHDDLRVAHSGVFEGPPARRSGGCLPLGVVLGLLLLGAGGVGTVVAWGAWHEYDARRPTPELEPLAPLPAPMQPRYPPVTEHEGALEASDRRWRDDSLYDEFPVDLPEGATVTLTLTSEAFAPYLIVVDPADTQILSAPPSGPGRVEATFFCNRGGFHRVIANAQDPAATGGPYRLRVEIALTTAAPLEPAPPG